MKLKKINKFNWNKLKFWQRKKKVKVYDVGGLPVIATKDLPQVLGDYEKLSDNLEDIPITRKLVPNVNNSIVVTGIDNNPKIQEVIPDFVNEENIDGEQMRRLFPITNPSFWGKPSIRGKLHYFVNKQSLCKKYGCSCSDGLNDSDCIIHGLNRIEVENPEMNQCCKICRTKKNNQIK